LSVNQISIIGEDKRNENRNDRLGIPAI